MAIADPCAVLKVSTVAMPHVVHLCFVIVERFCSHSHYAVAEFPVQSCLTQNDLLQLQGLYDEEKNKSCELSEKLATDVAVTEELQEELTAVEAGFAEKQKQCIGQHLAL